MHITGWHKMRYDGDGIRSASWGQGLSVSPHPHRQPVPHPPTQPRGPRSVMTFVHQSDNGALHSYHPGNTPTPNLEGMPSSAWATFLKANHMLNHKICLSTFQRTKIMQNTSEHNGKKIKVSKSRCGENPQLFGRTLLVLDTEQVLKHFPPVSSSLMSMILPWMLE